MGFWLFFAKSWSQEAKEAGRAIEDARLIDHVAKSSNESAYESYAMRMVANGRWIGVELAKSSAELALLSAITFALRDTKQSDVRLNDLLDKRADELGLKDNPDGKGGVTKKCTLAARHFCQQMVSKIVQGEQPNEDICKMQATIHDLTQENKLLKDKLAHHSTPSSSQAESDGPALPTVEESAILTKLNEMAQDIAKLKSESASASAPAAPWNPEIYGKTPAQRATLEDVTDLKKGTVITQN